MRRAANKPSGKSRRAALCCYCNPSQPQISWLRGCADRGPPTSAGGNLHQGSDESKLLNPLKSDQSRQTQVLTACSAVLRAIEPWPQVPSFDRPFVGGERALNIRHIRNSSRLRRGGPGRSSPSKRSRPVVQLDPDGNAAFLVGCGQPGTCPSTETKLQTLPQATWSFGGQQSSTVGTTAARGRRAGCT